LVLAWRFRFKVHSNAFMSNMIYVKKSVELIIFMSVGGTVSANRNVLIRLEKTVKQMTGSLLAIRGLLFLIGLKLSSIKTVFNMRLGFNYGFHLVCHCV
jgi:hypothetical protein